MASGLGSEVCLVVLCGLPAVGKSSLARELRVASAGLGWRSAALSYDELIPEEAFLTGHRDNRLSGEQQQQTEWRQHRQAVLKSIEHLLQDPSGDEAQLQDVCDFISKASWEKCVQDLLRSLSRPAPVVLLLDDNFYYPSMRYEVHQLARKHSWGFCQVFLSCDSETRVERNRSRARPVPSEVTEEMERRLEPPNPQRNWWERSSLELNTSDGLREEHIQTVVDLISFSLKNPLSPIEDNSEQKEADRLKCANSVVHQTDQACRKLVSDAMTTARDRHVPSCALRSLAAELNKQKSQFLQDLKTRLLRDSPFSESENLDVERVARGAAEVFHRAAKDVVLRTVEENAGHSHS